MDPLAQPIWRQEHAKEEGDITNFVSIEQFGIEEGNDLVKLELQEDVLILHQQHYTETKDRFDTAR